MNTPELDNPRVKVTPGVFTSNKLSLLANSRPFTWQVVIFISFLTCYTQLTRSSSRSYFLKIRH